jgi:hypothetical protein
MIVGMLQWLPLVELGALVAASTASDDTKRDVGMRRLV